MEQPPLFSIITPCLNRVDFIEDAIQSVLEQDYPHVEHLIIDGGSTDGTLELLAQYPHLIVVSESDEGLYDAINKGLCMARGDIIGFLNSDDLYEVNVFGEVARRFTSDPELDMVKGFATAFRLNTLGKKVIVKTYPISVQGEYSLDEVIDHAPIVNAKFYRKSLLDQVGFFDTQYAIASDVEFLMWVAIFGCNTVTISEPIYRYRFHSGSITINDHGQQTLVSIKEKMIIAENFLNNAQVSASMYQKIKRWHSREASELTLRGLRTGRYELLRYAIKHGWTYDTVWPLRFGHKMLVKLLDRYSRGIRNPND